MEGRTEGFPADDRGEVELRVAVNRSANAALEIDRPSFVEPARKSFSTAPPKPNMAQQDSQMLPAAVSDEVATPAVAELVGNDIHVLSISADECWCRKCEHGVFHP